MVQNKKSTEIMLVPRLAIFCVLETDTKKLDRLKILPLVKNPQFSFNLGHNQAKLPTHEVVILTKFHKDCKKIIDLLLRRKFLACAIFYASPFNNSQTT